MRQKSALAVLQQQPLDVPQSAGQVDIIGVRIFKALHFLPQQADLLGAVCLNVMDGRQLIDALSVFENRNLKLFYCEVGERLGFPCRVRVENRVAV